MTFFRIIPLALIVVNSTAQTRIISGTVKDAETRQDLAGCNVMLISAPAGTITDRKGFFAISISTQAIRPTLLFSYLGYKTDTLQVVPANNHYAIYLKSNNGILPEVVITGVSRATLIKENPVSIVSISPKAIERSSEANIIDVLVKNTPGLNAVKTGPNISKPYIHGLGYNRVLTLYDGVRQEGQQWGDEHGIEVDAYSIEKAEVIKGPSSLMFGSDAVAGVVSMFPILPHHDDGVVEGKFISEYQSNNGLIGNGFTLCYGNKHWMWASRGSLRAAKNYTNRVDGRVYNTGFIEKNLSELIGYKSENGYTHLNMTLYDNLQGIPDGSRDSLTRQFTKQIYEGALDNVKDRPIVSTAELNSYCQSPLHQHIQHYRVYSNNHYQLGKGDVDAQLGFQQNIRREFDHPTDPDQAGLYVRLNTFHYGLRYNYPEFSGIEVSAGTNGMYQNNKSKNATDFPIPDYNLLDVGAYEYAKWRYKELIISGGFRFDVRSLNVGNFYIGKNDQTGFEKHVFSAATAGTTLQFPALAKTYSGTSFSLGMTYPVTEKISIKANVARGYRSPNITEIASNGLDPGAHIFYLGNRNFVPEFSFQQDLGVIGNFNDLSGSLGFFNNFVQHYIYLTQLLDAQGNPIELTQGNKTYQYEQASAQLFGMDGMLSVNPRQLNGLSLNSNFSIVFGNNTKKEFENKGVNGQYLPFIPPFRVLSSIIQNLKTKSKVASPITFKAEVDFNSAQNRYLALSHTETRTPGYTLINVGMGTNLNFTSKSRVEILAQVNNLFDVAYQSNLSRLKYFEYYNQSPNGHLGIYSMGRNITLKMIFSF